MRTGVLSLIFAVFAVGCMSASADARPPRGHDGPSLDQILPKIREQHPGTFYDAEGPFIGPDGREHYRVKWGTPRGRVIWFDADARTGYVHGEDDFRPDRDFYDRPRDFNPDDDRGRGRRHRDRFDGDGGFGDPFGGDGGPPRGGHGEGRGNRHGGGGFFDGFGGGRGNGRPQGHGHDR